MIADKVDLALGVVALGGIVLGWWRWGYPRWVARRERERAKDLVLLGREAIPFNKTSGEPAQPRIPGLGERLVQMDAKQEYLIGKVHEAADTAAALARIEHRLAAGDGRMDRMEAEISDVKNRLVDTVANAAEASKTVLHVVADALAAEPPHTD